VSDEPDIVVNGTVLSPGQAMAVRVACTGFHTDITVNPRLLGTDDQGRRMAEAYRIRLGEVLQMMIGRVMT
jgi:hypothetical protein